MLVNRADLPVLGVEGRTRGHLAITLLPGSRPSPAGLLLDLRREINRDAALAPVQLLEDSEYRYEFQFDRQGIVGTDRPEVFEPDDGSGRTGRLRPGLSTGTIPIKIHIAGTPVGEIRLEVRSRKLNYLSEYRWMLRDLADSMAEIVMERFAASQQRFTSMANVNTKTLYQRFAFLQSLLEDESFVAALHRVVYRPYVAWNEVTEHRDPSRGVPAGSGIARSIARPGPRLRAPSASESEATQSWRVQLPRSIAVQRAEETLDNFPNRFVKFALTRWRDQASSVLEALSREKSTAPVERGRVEAARVTAALDELLAVGFFRDVGRLQRFASDNPVLLRREGYRDVYRAFLQFELAAQLSWAGGEDVYGAGQRNVATLYEYWAFLQVALVLSTLCQKQFDFATLFELQESGLALGLKRGRSVVLRGSLARLGRTILVELWFNRTFSSAGNRPPSWSREMRPDCSLRLSADCVPGAEVDDVWIHFDAKYRIDGLRQVFGLEESTGSNIDGTVVSDSGAKRDDLLKMHAYRDAIHRSAGAYILYPGDSDEQFKKYHELLPGLGVFALRPARDGEAFGLQALTRFLDDVVSHVASQLTQHERNRFWERTSYSTIPPQRTFPAVSFLHQPPADTKILLGYVKDAQHRAWIERTRLYNLRADNRRGSVQLSSAELAAPLLLLYGSDVETVAICHVVEEPVLKSREQMLELDYPSPRGSLYLCILIAPMGSGQLTPSISGTEIRLIAQQAAPGFAVGFPVVCTWQDLIERLTRARVGVG